MRSRSVVAAAALIAALALVGLPDPAATGAPSTPRAEDPAAFSAFDIAAVSAQAPEAPGPLDPALRSAGHGTGDTVFVEPGEPPEVTASRPRVGQPESPSGKAWKEPRYRISGYATFYDNGTTAMRLPRGTVVVICGRGGCIQRTVTDYGPQKPARIVDLYRPDFFSICGCAWYEGSTWVTVSVY